MAANDDLVGLALLGLGIGALAYAAGSTSASQRAFREQLATEMQERLIGKLVNCELGRGDGGAFWSLTINHPRRGVQVVRVRLGALAPYSQEAVAFVVERVSRWASQAL